MFLTQSRSRAESEGLIARNLVNKKKMLIGDIDPRAIGITESWANKDIADAELGLT